MAIQFINTWHGTRQALTENKIGKGLSHRVCALMSHKLDDWNDDFHIIWKSSHIRGKMEDKNALTDEQRGQLFNLFGVFTRLAEPTFVATIYKPYVHNILAKCEKGLPQMQPMRVITAHQYQYSESFETTSSSFSKYEEFPRMEKDLLEYRLLPSAAQLEFNHYYILEKPNDEFFDSFFLWDLGKYIVAVFIQISIATCYGCMRTTQGAIDRIEAVKDRAEARFRKRVEVMYLCVAPGVLPGDGSQKWTIDNEYFAPPVADGVDGRVFYLGVPLPPRDAEVAPARLAFSIRARSPDVLIKEDVVTRGRLDA